MLSYNCIQKLHVYKIIFKNDFSFEYKSALVCHRHVQKKKKKKKNPKKNFVSLSNCAQPRFFME